MFPEFVDQQIKKQRALIKSDGKVISSIHPDFRLSDNFTYREMIASDLAARQGINNEVQELDILKRAILVAHKCLQPIRQQFGIPIKPNSWYRSEALEKKLNWNAFIAWAKKFHRPMDDSGWAEYFARKSHPKGEAVDIEIPGISNDVLYDWCKTNLEFDQLIREFPVKNDPYSGWVHISFSVTGNRKQVFTIP